ncbi:AMP-binding protein [Egbenema bharatensis]|uniref:AMP-binding protein n=1 Tax=Egbenema bharatensis TaxID=3463334 RepID=UPI003A8C42E4
MAEPLALLHQRAQENWLIGLDQIGLMELADQRLQALQSLQSKQSSDRPLTLFLSETEPTYFLASLIAACTLSNSHLFLCNPRWSHHEWQQVKAIEVPDVVWGVGSGEWGVGSGEWQQERGRPKSKIQNPKSKILIPTGGSSGQVRFATHTWETLAASVNGFCAYFEVDRVHSCCMLPLYHVSGLMQFLRSFLTGGQFALPERLADSSIDFQNFFLSLVPTQLHRLLQEPVACDRLSQFHAVLLGGAPAWEELLEQAKQRSIRLAPTYGMTETASQVATLKPEDFLAGRSGVGRVLPHAQIQIQDGAGQALDPGEIGIVAIQAASLPRDTTPIGLLIPGFRRMTWAILTRMECCILLDGIAKKSLRGVKMSFPRKWNPPFAQLDWSKMFMCWACPMPIGEKW